MSVAQGKPNVKPACHFYSRISWLGTEAGSFIVSRIPQILLESTFPASRAA
jgi:hypothetical protein